MADDDTKDDVTTDPSSADPSEDTATEDTAKEDTEEKVEDVSDPETSSEVSESPESSSGSEGYQFDDDLTSSNPQTASSGQAPAATSQGGGKYAQEIFSKTIHAKFRTFYVDLKESVNGKFVKVSEKSKGRKSTIMMDAEDVPAMIEALQEVQKQL